MNGSGATTAKHVRHRRQQRPKSRRTILITNIHSSVSTTLRVIKQPFEIIGWLLSSEQTQSCTGNTKWSVLWEISMQATQQTRKVGMRF